MSERHALAQVLDTFALISRDQRVLRLAAAVAPLVVLGCARFAGATLPAWVVVVTLGLALLCAVEPDGHVAALAMAFLGWYWFAFVEAATTFLAVPAALAMLVLHVACAWATTAPTGATFDRETTSLWRRRVRLVALVTAAAWLVAVAARAVEGPGDESLTVAVLAMVALAAWWLRKAAA